MSGRVALALLLGMMLRVDLLGAEAEGPVKVRLHIIDAVTKVPISGARISWRKGGPDLEKLGESVNGLFDFTHAAPTQSMQLRVEAEAYNTQGFSVGLTNSYIQKTFELTRNNPFRGVVVAPTGHRSQGTRVFLLTKKERFVGVDKKGVAHGLSSIHSTTDPNGSFGIGPAEDAESILFLHELGMVHLPLVGWTNGTEVRLRAWAQVRGRMLINNAPAANQGIQATMVRHPGVSVGTALNGFDATTDANGNFFFDRMPMGEVLLMMKTERGGGSISYSHRKSFWIEPGSGTELIYHLQGREVRGRIGKVEGEFDWEGNTIFGMIMSKARGASEFTGFGESAMGNYYAIKVDINRAFEAVAVPPGEYVLNIRGYNRNRPRDSMQTIEGKVVVPEGEGSVDLGEVVLTSSKR